MDETIDLSDFHADLVTLTFSVPDHHIDARSLARVLSAFADFAGSVDAHLNPGQDVKIEVVALTTGSFRTHLRRVATGSAGFFSDGARQVFWGVVSGVLTFWILGGGPETSIFVEDSKVVIVSGDKTIIVSNDVYEAARAISDSDEVIQNGRAFVEALEADPEIDAVQLHGTGKGAGPGLNVTRADFGRLIREFDSKPQPRSRRRSERARLVVTKPSFHRKQRKWAFEWNGVPVSAMIVDHAFVETLVRRGFLFGFGDILEVDIEYSQKYNDAVGDYLNDPSSYEVVRVIRHLPSAP